jgi:hypothetical protein
VDDAVDYGKKTQQIHQNLSKKKVWMEIEKDDS